MPVDTWNAKPLIVIAHRGFSGNYPENTMIAFHEALKIKSDAIELDVYNIQNTLFVFHDDQLARLTGNVGFFDKLTISDVEQLRVNGQYKIPKLEEVLDLMLVHQDFNLNIELKGHDTAVATSELLNKYIPLGVDPNRFLVSSFRHNQLSIFKNHMPLVKTGALQVSLPITGAQFASDLKCYSVHMSTECIDKDFVTNAHQCGLKVYTFTVNDQEVFERMISLKVDGIFTDYPNRFAV